MTQIVTILPERWIRCTKKKKEEKTLPKRGGEARRGSGADRRFSSLHLCLRLVYGLNRAQPKPCIVFRGKGKSSAVRAEKVTYHPGVTVGFQIWAWMTEDLCVEFVEKSLEPFLRDRKPDSVAKMLVRIAKPV